MKIICMFRLVTSILTGALTLTNASAQTPDNEETRIGDLKFEQGYPTEERHLNDFVIADNYADPKAVWLTANDTTIYSLTNIDLGKSRPLVVEVPPIKEERYKT